MLSLGPHIPLPLFWYHRPSDDLTFCTYSSPNMYMKICRSPQTAILSFRSIFFGSYISIGILITSILAQL